MKIYKCALCGAEPSIKEIDAGVEIKCTGFCQNRILSITAPTEEEAVQEWNKRNKPKPKHTAVDLAQMQSLPLEAKISMTKNRIRDWYDHWNGDVYVSISGGKDSQVLAHLVKSMYADVPLVFVNTGLEYDSVRLKGIELADEVLRPEMDFVNVIKKYGYPIFSKEVAQAIDEAKRYIKILTDRQTDRQTDRDTVCIQNSGFLWNRSQDKQRQRILQGIKAGEYP